jgi:hypothetical protein
MHNMLNTKKFLALCLLTVPLMSVAQQRAAFGPVESLAVEKSSITVLGQTFSVTNATHIAINGRRVSLKTALPRLAPSQFVYIEGTDRADGSIATSLVLSRGEYVPGATEVYAVGVVAELVASEGLIRIGSLKVDTSSLAPELMSAIQVGSFVMVSGIQPLQGGNLVGPVQLSVGGSGIQTVGGSGIQSVGGSGIQSVGGSGIQSVGGSGIQSVGGSGIQSVGGSGIQSVGGSGIQSVGGSGIQSVGGSGIQSVGGSGIQSVGGSGIQSVGGSGVLSVGGSGIQSVGGSGTLSVGGSGLR